MLVRHGITVTFSHRRRVCLCVCFTSISHPISLHVRSAKSLNGLKQNIKKNNVNYEAEIAKYLENPEVEEAEAAGSDSDSDSESESESSSDSGIVSPRPSLPPSAPPPWIVSTASFPSSLPSLHNRLTPPPHFPAAAAHL